MPPDLMALVDEIAVHARAAVGAVRQRKGRANMGCGLGNDIYWIDASEHFTVEGANAGTDLINITGSINLDHQGGYYENIENLTLHGADDTVALGNATDNILIGNTGSNVADGKNGNDSFYGRNGNDSLAGGAGNDGLWGEVGNDTLTGGADGDRFVFRRHYDQDVVTDFQDNVDTIRLLDFEFTSVAQANNYATQSGSHVVFDFGQGDTFIVRNTTINELSNDLMFT